MFIAGHLYPYESSQFSVPDRVCPICVADDRDKASLCKPSFSLDRYAGRAVGLRQRILLDRETASPEPFIRSGFLCKSISGRRSNEQKSLGSLFGVRLAR